MLQPADFEQGRKSGEFEQEDKEIKNPYLTANHLFTQFKLFILIQKIIILFVSMNIFVKNVMFLYPNCS